MLLKPSLRIVLFSILSFLFSTHLFAITHSVAVMPFENVNKDPSLDWLSLGISENIINDLSIIKELILVERLQLRKVMEEQKLQLTGAIDEKSAVQVAKLIGASVLVSGTFQKQGQDINLTAKFIDVKTGSTIQTAKAAGKMEEIFDLQDQIVKDLVKNLNLQLSQEELVKLSQKPTTSLEAYQHFGLGLLLQTKKEYQASVAELEKAMEVDPKFAIAKEKFKDAFWSLKKGNFWIYESKTEGLAKSSFIGTHRAGGIEEFNGQPAYSMIVEIAGESELAGKQVEHRSKSTGYFIKSDDGIYMVGDKSNYEVQYEGSHEEGLVFGVNDPPFFKYPYKLSVGDIWKGKEYVQKGLKRKDVASGEMFEFMRKLGTIDIEVVKLETVTVSAGTFHCFVVRSVTKQEMVGVATVNVVTMDYFAPGVGVVKQISESESRTKTGIPLLRWHKKLEKPIKFKTTVELKEYHIEE